MTTKKRIFPIAFKDEGGVSVPYEPTAGEMTNCAFAQQASTECPRLKEESINCGNCIPQKEAMRGMFTK